jgi:hypothetical protein
MTDISLACETCSTFCLQDTQKAIDRVLVPMDQAKPGDFVGFEQGVETRIGSESSEPSTHQIFFRKTREGVEWVRYRTLVEENNAKVSDLAHVALMTLDDTTFDKTVARASIGLNPDNREAFYASAIFMPRLLAVVEDDFDIALERNDIETIDKADNPSDLIKLIKRKAPSAHKDIERMPVIQQSLRALAAILKLKDESGEPVKLSLR